MAFIIDAGEEDMPVTYAGATVGDVLTIAVTNCAEVDELMQTAIRRNE